MVTHDRYYWASAWWRDNDPFTGVVGTSAKKVETALRRAMREEAKVAYDDGSYGRLYKALDDIAWSGVHAESAAFTRQQLSASEWEELQDEGIVYPSQGNPILKRSVRVKRFAKGSTHGQVRRRLRTGARGGHYYLRRGRRVYVRKD